MEPYLSDVAIAQAYFNRFVRAFAIFDGHQIANLFLAPGVALRRDGSVVAFASQKDVVCYYQAALDHYHREGCRACRWSQLVTVPMGRQSLLATVTWDLLREDGTSVIQWRQSYSLKFRRR
jgi:hypothetical protein